MTTEILIVSHGSPSDPAPQEAAMAELAGRVGTLLPGHVLRGATLAAPGALTAALRALRSPAVYPFFMADGFFVGTRLPERLAEAGRPVARILPPFGTDPALPGLCLAAALAGAEAAGLAPEQASLLLAAHGSAISRGSARSTEALAAEIAAQGRFARVATAFVEEDPRIEHVAEALPGPALCLPLFTLTAGHVTGDLPDALEAAGFAGPLLPPVGAHPDVPALIAAAIRRAAPLAA